LYCRYETKPALSVPIHVVELTNVPPELRMSAAVPENEEIKTVVPSKKPKPKEWVTSIKAFSLFSPAYFYIVIKNK